ncbi:hypothetical protein K439DRAFT_490399 [Ramaria rubella]|nr:hypothetical protein K439DRAFT_695208 [Ramaria rubella]KAF8578254.1 hypothetical protein K439DRAFT_490399 [Ramaria rubella]
MISSDPLAVDPVLRCATPALAPIPVPVVEEPEPESNRASVGRRGLPRTGESGSRVYSVPKGESGGRALPVFAGERLAGESRRKPRRLAGDRGEREKGSGGAMPAEADWEPDDEEPPTLVSIGREYVSTSSGEVVH